MATLPATATLSGLVTLSQDDLELIQFADTFLATAQAVKITTQEEAQEVVDQVRRAKECKDALETTRKAHTKPLDDEKKAWMDAFRPAIEVMERVETLLKGALGAWDAEQRRLAAEAEKARRAQEAEEQKRREAEQADAPALLAKADEAAARGDIAGAQALEDQAMAAQQVAEVPAPAPLVMAPAKTKGASSRTVWKCRVVNAALVPREYCVPNQAVLDAMAATTKGAGPAPAGCEWYSDTVVSVRR